MSAADENDLGWLRNQLRHARRRMADAERVGKKGRYRKQKAMVERLERIISRIEPYRSDPRVLQQSVGIAISPDAIRRGLQATEARGRAVGDGGAP